MHVRMYYKLNNFISKTLIKQLTIAVFEFPPNESCKRRVNLEFRYGICVDFPSTNAEITLPNVDNDKLIFVASFNVLPSAPDFD
jgi:hypothetical protein